MKKALALILSLLLILTLFAGCGAKEETAAPDEPAKEEAAASDGENWDIEYCSMWSEGEPAAEWLRGVAKQYEEETGGKVTLTFVGRDVLTTMKTRMLTGDAPDLLDQDGSEISAAFLKSGDILATPMDDFLDTDNLDGTGTMRDLYNQPILDMYKAEDGHIYFAPYQFVTSGFYYDKNLWNELGFEIPSTWEEFVALNEEFKAAGLPMICADNDPNYNSYFLYWAIARVSGSGTYYAAAGDPTGEYWRSEEALQAAKMCETIGAEMLQPNFASCIWPAGQSDFALGNQGCLLCGSWIPNELSTIATDFDWGFFPFPTVNEDKSDATDMEAYLIGWSIPAGAKNVKGAEKFIQIASTVENQNVMAEKTVNMSAIKGTVTPDALADIQPYLENATNFHKSFDGVASDYPQWFADVSYVLFDQLITGQITAEAFCEAMAEQSVIFWENHG